MTTGLRLVSSMSRAGARVMVVTAVLVAVMALTVAMPWNNYYLALLTQAAAWAIAAYGLVVVIGYAGQISLAQATFFGVGAYAVGIGCVTYHVEFWIASLIGVALAAALGTILGMAALRVGGHYLAMVTISFQIVFGLFLVNQLNFTQGPNGINGIPRAPLGPISVDDNHRYLVFCVFALYAVGGLVWALSRTRTGRAMRALRENELAAEVIGIPTYIVKVEAFVLSAILGALGGILYAGSYSFISPDDFSFSQSILFMAMTLLGGAQSVFGTALGALLVAFLPEWLQFIQTGYLAVYGLALIVFMVVMPEGIWGFLESVTQRVIRFPAAKIPTVGAHEFGHRAVQSDLVLEARGVGKRFGGLKALDSVDLVVRRGEVHALIGPNGSGKTTLLNVVSGIYSPNSGEVWLDGRRVSGRRPHQIARAGLARTFQLIRLMKSETVLENVLVGVQVTPRNMASESPLRLRAISALELVGMAQMAHLPVKTLPYGHQRLVEIARALATMPAVLLLDEPAAGLNHSEKQKLIDLIARFRRESLTVVLIEHDMELVRRVSDTVTVLNFGKKIAEGQPAEILRDPAVQEAYLGVKHGAT